MLVSDLNSAGSCIPKQAYMNLCQEHIAFMVQKGISHLIFDDVDGFYHLVVTSKDHWFLVCSDDVRTLKEIGIILSQCPDIHSIEWMDEKLEETGETALFYFEKGKITLDITTEIVLRDMCAGKYFEEVFVVKGLTDEQLKSQGLYRVK
jgi:hypothetical protein